MQVRHVVVGLLVILSLTACGGGGKDKKIACTSTDVPPLRLCIAEGWERMGTDQMASLKIPEETLAAFRSSSREDGQRFTLVATREEVSDVPHQIAYGEANRKSVQALPGYEHLEDREVTVAGSPAVLHTFVARPIADQPKRRFYQVSLLQESIGYTVTASSPLSIEKATEDSLFQMVQSPSFPASEEDRGDEQEQQEEK